MKMNQGELLRRAKRIPGAWTGLKIAVLILLSNEWTAAEVEDAFGLSRQTVNRWRHEAEERGYDSLQKTSPPGRPGRLTREVREKLSMDISLPADSFGYARKRWTAPLLVKHLRKNYKIKVKPRQARNYLRELRQTEEVGSGGANAKIC